jgi:CubicO group peptidase (beta-lactamase class C family)
VTASADELLPGTRRALAHRVAVGQAEGRAPSLVGAVVRDGRQAWCGSSSMLEGHELTGTPSTASAPLTKTFVAVLVMRLRDEGRLDLADPLGRYLEAPGIPGVTIAQLLSHTAGLASEAPGPWWERTPGALRPELADVLGPRPHPAGRRFHYSNPGFALLGALVGRLRGQDWTQALRREILDPLGMTRTTTSPEPPHARGFAVHPWADAMQLEPAEPTGLMAPAGELWSTADDLCRFAAFLLDGDDRVLAASTLAEMREPASPPGDDAWAGGYGLGLQLARPPLPDGRLLAGHGGSMPGFLAALWVSPDHALGAITLARGRPGPARADRPVVLGTPAVPAAAARRTCPGALTRGRPGPRLAVPGRARRDLDRPGRLLPGGDAARRVRPRRPAGAPGPRDVRVHPPAVRPGRRGYSAGRAPRSGWLACGLRHRMFDQQGRKGRTTS